MLLKDLIQDFKFEIFGAKLGTEIEHVTADPENHAENSLYILLKQKNDIKKAEQALGLFTSLDAIIYPTERHPTPPFEGQDAYACDGA